MNLVISKCVTAVKVANFSGHYLRNHSTLDIDVLGYIGIVQHKEHSPEVLSIPPGTPCIQSETKFAVRLLLPFDCIAACLCKQVRNADACLQECESHLQLHFD